MLFSRGWGQEGSSKKKEYSIREKNRRGTVEKVQDFGEGHHCETEGTDGGAKRGGGSKEP